MPKYSSAQRGSVDDALTALAHPARRWIVERLAQGPASLTDLSAPLGVALPTQLQHLRLLEGAGIVTSTKNGRVRTYRLREDGLRVASTWLADQSQIWERRLDQLDATLLRLRDTTPPDGDAAQGETLDGTPPPTDPLP